MDGKYIFALVILGLFFILILVSFAFLEYGRRKEEKLQNWVKERYADKDLSKIDYDTVAGDDEIPDRSVRDAADAASDANKETVEEVQPIVEDYGKIDVEGIEEITGNYDGNK